MALAFSAPTRSFVSVTSQSSERTPAPRQLRAPSCFSKELLPRLNIWSASRDGAPTSRQSPSCPYVPRCRSSDTSADTKTAPTPYTESVSGLDLVLGVDFGGTGIKAAPVDITTGRLTKERVRIPTPSPATPQAVAQVVKQLQQEFQWQGPIGIGMPSVVKKGRVHSAANIDKSWIDIDAVALFEKATGCQVAVLNDADAAGYAELAFGAAQELSQRGVVLMTTFGTGIGTAMFVDGTLVPNLELGHVEVNGVEAEKWASERVREKEELSWKKWAQRVNDVLATFDRLLQPELIIVGGGVSKKDDKFLHLLSVDSDTEIVAAQMRNDAGIVGAAVGGFNLLQRESNMGSTKGDAQTHTYLHHEKVFAFHQAAKEAAEALDALGIAAAEARPVQVEQGGGGNGTGIGIGNGNGIGIGNGNVGVVVAKK